MDKKQELTGNISAKNDNIKVLKSQFSHCFDKEGNFDYEKFKKELKETEVVFSKESYGLDWLGRSYARLLANDEGNTLLKEDQEWNNIDQNKKSDNLLIKGDNLEVLKHLTHAYYEKVKMIYIDPPYNTGSDGFVYEDDRKYSVNEFKKLAGVEEEKAKRVLSFIDSKSNSHSAWLTFMYPRLYIAKNLLKNDGVIFISIDDHEVAQLKLLMDEIFGEENFVGDIIRKTKSMTGDEGSGFNIQHENLLVYAKKKFHLMFRGEEKAYKNYKNPDDDKNGKWTSGDPSAKSGSDSTYFEIVNPFTKKSDFPPKGRYWAFSKETLKKYIDKGKVVFKENYKDNERGFIFKRYKNDLKDIYNPVSSLNFSKNEYLNQVGTKELRKLFENELFPNPKPKILLTDVIKYSTNPSNQDIILDFFAGSGTTADAVMQLNAEDGGNRKFILVQLPEKIDKKKNKAAYEFIKNELKVEEPTIFEITKERIIRAAKKIQSDNKDKDLFSKENQKQDFGFKIFETTPIWDDYLLQSEDFNNQIKLFDESKLNQEDINTLLTTWQTYDNIPLTKSLIEKDLDGYKAMYFDDKLYLMNKGFETKNLKKLLEEIDNNRDFSPATIIAFGYMFESTKMREISENVKSYANKKQIDIDFIIRY